MDEETRQLVAAMSARAGMIMEDTSIAAVTNAGFALSEAPATLTYLADAAATISALIEAASHLERFAREGRHAITR
ncbi:MAG: hypothetical protein V4530_00480 [Pseudomonadota bacterium]